MPNPPAFDEIVENFALFDGWEDRYRYVIDLGRSMPPLDPALKTEGARVTGCASQVWIVPRIEGGRLSFEGDSDAAIVRGLIAVLRALYAGRPVAEAAAVDASAELARLDLGAHLSAQRSNGVAAMITRLRDIARAASG